LSKMKNLLHNNIKNILLALIVLVLILLLIRVSLFVFRVVFSSAG